MIGLARRWRSVLESLWFLPGAMIVAFGGLAFGLIEVDRAFTIDSGVVFSGDGAAARTVLSVLAGSLITVAGVSLSLVLLVLQLASSQFSPRVLPGFLGDRLTQVTVGAFVGIFTFSLITLRSVGGGLVPRLTVTVASGLGVIAVILLVAFIHHVSRIIQVSRIAARIAASTLRRLEKLYPQPFGEGQEEDPARLVAEWRRGGAPCLVRPPRGGYVEDVALEPAVRRLDGLGARVHVRAVPGDFVTPHDALAEVWADDPEQAADAVGRAFGVADERSLALDVGFGIRQLADVALRALSPSLNDPTTARTCIGYLRAILEALAGRDLPAPVRRFEDSDAVVVARRREFDDHLAPLVEIARAAGTSVEVTEALLAACESVAEQARAAGAAERAQAMLATAATIAEQSGREDLARADRRRVQEAAPGPTT